MHYWGETHRSVYDRIREHMEDLQKNKEENPLVKHMVQTPSGKHPGVQDLPWQSLEDFHGETDRGGPEDSLLQPQLTDEQQGRMGRKQNPKSHH